MCSLRAIARQQDSVPALPPWPAALLQFKEKPLPPVFAVFLEQSLGKGLCLSLHGLKCSLEMLLECKVSVDAL